MRETKLLEKVEKSFAEKQIVCTTQPYSQTKRGRDRILSFSFLDLNNKNSITSSKRYVFSKINNQKNLN